MFFCASMAPTATYTLSLHDALPICRRAARARWRARSGWRTSRAGGAGRAHRDVRSEEHTSELQSHSDLVCRLLLEKKKLPNKISDSEALASLLVIVLICTALAYLIV